MSKANLSAFNSKHSCLLLFFLLTAVVAFFFYFSLPKLEYYHQKKNISNNWYPTVYEYFVWWDNTVTSFDMADTISMPQNTILVWSKEKLISLVSKVIKTSDIDETTKVSPDRNFLGNYHMEAINDIDLWNIFLYWINFLIR